MKKFKIRNINYMIVFRSRNFGDIMFPKIEQVKIANLPHPWLVVAPDGSMSFEDSYDDAVARMNIKIVEKV